MFSSRGHVVRGVRACADALVHLPHHVTLQVSQAVASGADVRGFYYWTLVDNFEWHLGYNMK